uniref:C-type lectin n=1 Tax=Stichopus japonicus TaxID=307972 RepID=E9NVZ2_STIJA|nr:C-type lectin [Apostichopus japonicus]
MFKTILFLVGVCLFGPVQGCLTACPEFWTGFDGKCYRLFHDHLTFTEAEHACRAFKLRSCNGNDLATGHLASIHSSEEQQFVIKLVQQSLPSLIDSPSYWDPQVLLGLKVGTTNSDLTWTDGSDVDYTAWFSGEPNNGPDSRAAIAAGSHSQGNWADVFDSSSLKYCVCFPVSSIIWSRINDTGESSVLVS